VKGVGIWEAKSREARVGRSRLSSQPSSVIGRDYEPAIHVGHGGKIPVSRARTVCRPTCEERRVEGGRRVQGIGGDVGEMLRPR